MAQYQRIMLKLSGEQLAGKHDGGIDVEFGAWLAREVKQIVEQKIDVLIVIGGGNIVRGAQIEGGGIKRVTGDHMGMLATMINALALTDIFESQGVPTRCLSNIFAEQVAEPFVYRLAEKHLERGRVVIVAGGAGRPYMTTDTAAVSVALEMRCNVVLKATKVDGVYDKDPAKYEDAQKLYDVSHQMAVENPAIKVMDKAALGLAMEHDLPIIIFDSSKDGNLLRVVRGEHVGTRVG